MDVNEKGSIYFLVIDIRLLMKKLKKLMRKFFNNAEKVWI